jgi:hypothetical protein
MDIFSHVVTLKYYCWRKTSCALHALFQPKNATLVVPSTYRRLPGLPPHIKKCKSLATWRVSNPLRRGVKCVIRLFIYIRHTCSFVFVCVRASVCMRVCWCACVRVCTRACVRVCVCVCVREVGRAYISIDINFPLSFSAFSFYDLVFVVTS